MTRGEFQSRVGFILAAAGSAVGLGNIWGFPTQAASNGGAAFLITYLILAFVLAYPALMAELLIGRHAPQHGTGTRISARRAATQTRREISGIGWPTHCQPNSLFLRDRRWLDARFLCVVSTWGRRPHEASEWLVAFTPSRNLFLMLGFMGLTMAVVLGGVENGIERWSRRLMPFSLPR